jgi:hypothetical protein
VTFFARQIAAISAIGSIVPTSPLAVITETKVVSLVRPLSTSAGSTRPAESTGTVVDRKPNRSRLFRE